MEALVRREVAQVTVADQVANQVDVKSIHQVHGVILNIHLIYHLLASLEQCFMHSSIKLPLQGNGSSLNFLTPKNSWCSGT